MSKVYWQTIYCEKSTVEETGHLITWAMFGQHDTSIISIIIFEAHTEGCNYLFVIEETFVYYMFGIGWKGE